MKAKYFKPLLKSTIVNHEESIATTSFSTVSFGDNDNPYNPEVTDWESSDLGPAKFEI